MQSQIKGKARSFSNTGHLRSFLQTFPSPKKKAGHSDFSLLSICYHKKSPSYSQIRTSVWQAQPLDTSFSAILRLRMLLHSICLQHRARATFPHSSPLNKGHSNSSHERSSMLFLDSTTAQNLLQCFLLSYTAACSFQVWVPRGMLPPVFSYTLQKSHPSQ